MEIKSPMSQTHVVDGQVEDKSKDIALDEKLHTAEMRRVYRRKALLVEANVQADGNWAVVEAGRKVVISKEDFAKLYEVLDVGAGSGMLDVGLPDLEPGERVERDGKRYVRVVVHAGRGGMAYWANMQPSGSECGYAVVADMNDNMQASHRVGRFVEPWEGKPGGRTWVELGVGK